MWKTKRMAMMLALGMLLVLFNTAFAAAPAQARVSQTASSPTTSSQQLQAVWGSWGEVPGKGLTVSGPATTHYNGNDYVFVRGTNNHIYMWHTIEWGWSGWSEVPGQGLTLSAPAVTTMTSPSGLDVYLHLFVRGTDNKIYENTLNGTTWSGWSEVPGKGFTLDSPAALGDFLFVRGTNDHIYMNSLGDIAWSGWSEVPGHGLTLSGPTAAYFGAASASLHLFVRGTNNHLYVNRMYSDTTWSGWSEVSGHGLTPSAPAATTLYFNAGITLYLFVRGTDNKIYLNTYNGTSWSGWSEVPGHGLTPDAPGAIAYAGGESVGWVYLYVRGTNDRIYGNNLQVTP